MAGLGALGLAAPWFLLAGLVLPLIWWLLRVTPPAPRLVAFPPIRFVLALRSPEESPARTPLWLIVLRTLIAALVILALAGPVLNPTEGLRGSGPLILIVDNGWPSARDWQDRVAAWERGPGPGGARQPPCTPRDHRPERRRAGRVFRSPAGRRSARDPARGRAGALAGRSRRRARRLGGAGRRRLRPCGVAERRAGAPGDAGTRAPHAAPGRSGRDRREPGLDRAAAARGGQRSRRARRRRRTRR